MTLSEISVVIPTYNGSRFIREAIESIYAQTCLPREIIVVDDCSTDDTLAVVESMKANSPIPLNGIQLKKNSGGPSHPINVGVTSASGQFIAVLDQDDVYSPEIMERVTSALAKSPECSMAFYWAGDYDNRDRGPLAVGSLREKIAMSGIVRDGYIQIPGRPIIRFLVSSGMIAGGYPGFVFRKEFWSRKGGVDESLRISSDQDLFSYLAWHGDVALIPIVGYFRRDHDSNVTNNRLLLNYETGLVIGRMARALDGKPQDPELVEMATNIVSGLAYWFREAQHYRQSIDLYRLAGQVSNRRIATWVALFKLQMHRVLANVFGRRPVVRPVSSSATSTITSR